MNTCVKSVFSLPPVQAMQEKDEATAETIQVSKPLSRGSLELSRVFRGMQICGLLARRERVFQEVDKELHPPTQAAGLWAIYLPSLGLSRPSIHIWGMNESSEKGSIPHLECFDHFWALPCEGMWPEEAANTGRRGLRTGP